MNQPQSFLCVSSAPYPEPLVAHSQLGLPPPGCLVWMGLEHGKMYQSTPKWINEILLSGMECPTAA